LPFSSAAAPAIRLLDNQHSAPLARRFRFLNTQIMGVGFCIHRDFTYYYLREICGMHPIKSAALEMWSISLWPLNLFPERFSAAPVFSSY